MIVKELSWVFLFLLIYLLAGTIDQKSQKTRRSEKSNVFLSDINDFEGVSKNMRHIKIISYYLLWELVFWRLKSYLWSTWQKSELEIIYPRWMFAERAWKRFIWEYMILQSYVWLKSLSCEWEGLSSEKSMKLKIAFPLQQWILSVMFLNVAKE